MERIKCTISYDGTHFSGYQIQLNGRTVQEAIEKALQKMHKGRVIRVHASGRTDAGVHAREQVLHFDTPLQIPPQNWVKALNTLVPEDILVKHVGKVADDFHARYDVVAKEYRYFILNKKEADVFWRNHADHIAIHLDIKRMEIACRYLEGEHDFTSFCSAKADVKGSKIRTIYQATCCKNENMVTLTFKGSGFLYNMVRILAGTLIEVGLGEIEPVEVEKIMTAKDRSSAGKTAPARGLYLWEVYYDEKK